MRLFTIGMCALMMTLVCAIAAAQPAPTPTPTPPPTATGRTFEIANTGGSRVQFVSDAPLETITGVTSDVTGRITADPSNLRGAQGRIAVRIAAVRTGIDLRDEHLRSNNWLNAQQFPEAVFEITGVEGPNRLQPNRDTNLRIRGRFTVHGVTRDVVAQGRVQLVPATDATRAAHVTGDALIVRARFTIHLPDFNIAVPAAIRLKVSDEIEVNVSLRATAAAS